MYTGTQIETIFSSQFCVNARHIAMAVNKDLKATHFTNYGAKLHGLNDFEAALGLSSYELKAPTSKSAPEFERQFRKVIDTGQPLTMLDIHTYSDGTIRFFYSFKTPICSFNQDIKGCYTKCVEIDSTAGLNISANIIGSFSHFTNTKKPISISLELIEAYTLLNLTKRESECLYYLIRGRSNNDIGHILNISRRTVDTHTDNIKLKLDVNTRTDIIDHAFAQGLINQIPRSIVKNHC
ncbi:MAG: helix-turn-helix transcriptional regulator [Gammaproteobacteria bacterium]|nr:helix-turn-helix transcriptional regulator [Gammaproteobacteria bacterium]MCH9744325.1 helix-turn-helix transcriptional regulator [Gammaproteobacteria bacterium]